MSKASTSKPGMRVGEGVVTRVADLMPGDVITEVDTPDGPWYEVAMRDEQSITLDARLDPNEPELLVSLAYAPTGAVLRRTT